MPDRSLKPVLPELVDLSAIARHLGVSPRHVRRLVAERRIPFVKWGHLLRFDPVEVSEWLDANRLAVRAGRLSLPVMSANPSPAGKGRAHQARWETRRDRLPDERGKVQ